MSRRIDAGTDRSGTTPAGTEYVIGYRSGDTQHSRWSFQTVKDWIGTAASIAWDNVTGKPSTFTPSTHASSHAAAGSDPLTLAQSQVTSLTTDLAAKETPAGAQAKADAAQAAAVQRANHTGSQAISTVSGLQTALDGKASTSHTHEGTAILSTGETGGTKFLREDGDGTSSWQTIAGGGDALTSSPLSQFAATTSSQLAGVISDETGSGALVFATSPTLVTPNLGTPSAINLTNATALPSHTHTLSQITDAGDSAGLDVGTTAGTVAAGDHTHSGAYQPLATVLTNTTAAFTTAQETKLSGIETAATADQTAAEIKTALETLTTTNRLAASAVKDLPVEFMVAVSDETTDLTTGTAKITFRMPYAMTLTAVRAGVNTAPVGSTIVVDINEGGTTILSTKLSIDASEKTSTTAATAAVISDSALADDAEITIDIDQVGSSTPGKGLKVTLIGTRA